MKKRKGCLTSIIVFLVVFAALCVIVGIGVSKSQKQSAQTLFGKELKLSKSEEEKMLKTFEDCGIGEIVSISDFQSGKDRTSYNLEDNETSAYKGVEGTIVVWVDNETKEIDSIYFNDHDIFENGSVIAPITNYYVNKKDRDDYRVSAQLAINQLLNYPDSAKYPSESGWKFSIKDGIVIAQSSVTAKNAFGMEDTNEFQIEFENKKIISIILDGQKYL